MAFAARASGAATMVHAALRPVDLLVGLADAGAGAVGVGGREERGEQEIVRGKVRGKVRGTGKNTRVKTRVKTVVMLGEGRSTQRHYDIDGFPDFHLCRMPSVLFSQHADNTR